MRRDERHGEQQPVEIVVAIGVGLVSYLALLGLGAVIEHFADVRLTGRSTLADVFLLGSAGVAFLVMLGVLHAGRRR